MNYYSFQKLESLNSIVKTSYLLFTELLFVPKTRLIKMSSNKFSVVFKLFTSWHILELSTVHFFLQEREHKTPSLRAGLDTKTNPGTATDELKQPR